MGLQGDGSGISEPSTQVCFYQSNIGKRDVVEKFLAKDLKRMPDARLSLVEHLQFIQQTRISTLRQDQRLEHVEGDILSYKFKVPTAGNIWVRLLAAEWPDGRTLYILAALVKKKNRLDREMIDLAKENLAALKRRASQEKASLK